MGSPSELLHYLITWNTSPFPLLCTAVELSLAAWYVEAMRQLQRKGRIWPVKRLVAFLAGLAAVAVALQSSVSIYVMYVFPDHIAQHLLLMIVAPTLLALSAPVTLLLQWADRDLRRRILRLLKSSVLHYLTFPLVVFCLYYVIMWVFFLTPLIKIAMDHMWFMDILNVVFLAGGIMFWWPIVGLDDIHHWKPNFGGKFFSLVIGIPLESFLGIILSSTSRPLDPAYSPYSWYVGGQVLWGAQDVLTVAALLILFLQWIKSDERAARRADAGAIGDGAGVATRGGVPHEWHWIERTLASVPPGSELYDQAMALMLRLESELPHPAGKPEPDLIPGLVPQPPTQPSTHPPMAPGSSTPAVTAPSAQS